MFKVRTEYKAKRFIEMRSKRVVSITWWTIVFAWLTVLYKPYLRWNGFSGVNTIDGKYL